MASQISIDVARDFSPYPAGRDDLDGPFNGQRFRVELLYPRFKEALESHQTLLVSFDGVRSFGSSFLEAAFGGLIRENLVNKPDLIRILKIDGSPDRYKLAITRYIEKA